jgi:hypothetical protein
MNELRRFLYRFDKDEELQASFQKDPMSALAGFSLTDAEKALLISRDAAGMLRAGVHPLLVRNFAGTIKLDYVSAYREAGLTEWPEPTPK